jgi:hypothetical protein
MPEESNTITIARPVGDVFAFLADAVAATLGGVKKLMAPMAAKTIRSEVAALTELKRVLENRS